MNCPRCRHENPLGFRFCQSCGVRLAQACGSCGAAVPASARFCGSCGAKTSDQDAPRFASPRAYTPRHLAEHILTSRAALEGERKQVTVLFADLKGSMELLAERDPEEAGPLLDPVLELMMEAVHRYEGTVNQVMSDGIMALFGAPLALEDHAVRACHAALRMRDAVRRYSDELRGSHGVEVQIRVGVNSGEVLVRSIGSDLHMDYTAVGQTTHLAARMEQLAPPGSIRITSDTLRLAEGYVTVTTLGLVPVKGLSEPVEVYELTGAVGAHARFQVSARRGLSRFVGRAQEMETLGVALGEAARGHGQVVALAGEPGVGKSRLFHEFINSHHTRGWLVIQAGSVSYGTATPYLPVIDLLKDYFRIEERDDQRQVREKVTGKVLAFDDALRRMLPALLSLLDVDVEDRDWQALDPSERRRHTHEAVTRALLRESQVQPLCVVFEDLHWVDAETQAVLDGLVGRLPGARILLLVNYRPEYRHGWGTSPHQRTERLEPLRDASATEFLDALLGADSSLDPLKQLVIERTDGNPFFVEETMRTLVETGLLAGAAGAYRLAGALGSIQVPPTVRAVLAARIDRLSPEDKSLLQEASVIGTDVPWTLLSRLADLPEPTLRERIGRLVAGEFLYWRRLFPDLLYTFTHAITHDVAYGSLLSDRRRSLHARIVAAIEEFAPDRRGEHVERLAHHSLRGEVWAKAEGYLRQAATRAIGRGALAEAATYLEQAVDALDHLPRGAGTVEEAIDLRLGLRNALFALGQHERVFPHLEAAERLATESGDAGRLARVLRYLSTHFLAGGAYARAIEFGERAVQTAASTGDVDLEREARLGLALVHFPRGDFRQACDSLERLAADLGDEGPRPRLYGIMLFSVAALGFLAPPLAERGRFDEAVTAAEDALRRAEEHEPRYSLPFAAWSAGYASLRRGDLGPAAKMLELAVDRSRAAGLPIVFPAAASMLGLAHALAGRPAEAVALLDEAVARAGSGWSHALPFACLAEGYLLAGRGDEAEHEAVKALDLARAKGERGIEAWILRLLGEVGIRGDTPRASALDAYRDALALASELDMRPLAALCHLGMGKLHQRMGPPERAHEHLTTAAAMLRSMGMQLWLDEAEASLAKG
jgi:class 3 adenylate cyclase/tetratricopeptide (TPR) repeat protein